MLLWVGYCKGQGERLDALEDLPTRLKAESSKNVTRIVTRERKL